jgi:thioredoxin reductase (NADPH)
MEPLKDSGIEFLWNSRVTEIHGDKKVTGVTVEAMDGLVKEISCDAVFVAIGRIPDTELFQGQVELDQAGYIIADETTKTNLPGVFAVGDVRTKPLRQIVTAAADGAVASRFIEEYFA